MKKNNVLWVTNICNRNVTLSDLNLTIKAYSSINLLDKKHYNYTLEQVNKSVSNGSIFNKRNKIVVRTFPPNYEKENKIKESNNFISSRERSVYSIKEEYYEELDISDDDFIENNVNIDIADDTLKDNNGK